MRTAVLADQPRIWATTANGVPCSNNLVAAVCRRSWKRKPARSAWPQARLQAERQFSMGRSGSIAPFAHAGNTKCSEARPGKREAHTLSAAHAGWISGMGRRLPASVLLWLTLKTRFFRSKSFHLRLLISLWRIPVLSPMVLTVWSGVQCPCRVPACEAHFTSRTSSSRFKALPASSFSWSRFTSRRMCSQKPCSLRIHFTGRRVSQGLQFGLRWIDSFIHGASLIYPISESNISRP